MPDIKAAPRRLRLCDICGGLDDHPRHVIDGQTVKGAVSTEFLESLPDGIPATAIAEAITDNVHVRHIDCCAAAGCAICQATEKATKGVRGQALIDAIHDGALDGFEPPEVTSNEALGLTYQEESTDG